MRIRRLALLVGVLLSTGGITAGHGDAQEPRKAYLVIDHIEIPPGMGRDFLRTREEVIRPIHQVAVDEGKMLRWSLYWVASSTDPERKQRVVTVRMYRTLEDMDQSSVPGAFERAHPGKRAEEVLPPLMRMREIVHREIWEIADDAAVGRTGLPGKFAIVDYYDTSPGADPVALELELWKPLHQARAEAGKITDWGVYRVLVPSSELYPYDYITVNSFDSNTTLRDPYPSDLVQRILDGRDARDVLGRMREARAPVKQEYWHRYVSTR